MSLALPLLLLLGAADPAPAATPAAAVQPPAATTTETAPSTLRVLLLPVGGDISDATRDNLNRAILARFKRFSGLVITPALDDGGCGGADDRRACLQALATAANVDVVVATGADTSGGDATVSMLVLQPDGTTLSETSSSMSRMDGGTITDAANKALRATADALLERDPQHFSEGGVTTKTNTTKATTTTTMTTTMTTTKLDQDALRQGVLIGGAAGVGVGVLTIVAGSIPGVLASQAVSQLSTLRNDYVRDGGDAAVLEQARAQQVVANDAVATWNGVGVPVVWTGIVLTALGGAALATAVFALPATEIEAEAEAGSTP